MTKQQKILLAVGLCALAVCAVGAGVFQFDHQPVSRRRALRGLPTTVPGSRLDDNRTVQIPPGVLNSSAQQKLDGLNASDKAAVSTFLAYTSGPLDNYLLNLEGMTDLANARYGEPDQAAWAQALPIARVLEEGMCDCAQRNWLNQFIALGESGLTGDAAKYHEQGEVMATIGRFNGDSVDRPTVTTAGTP